MKELLTGIVKALVDDPRSVSINEVEGRQVTIFEVKVAKQDRGKIIGKQGRNADALRILLSAVAAKHHKKVVLEVVEE